MSLESLSTWSLACLAAFAAIGVTWLVSRRPSYTQRAIMTPNEAEFFRRLTRAHSHGFVFAQVALSALMEPRAAGQAGLKAFRRISQKRVDYTLHAPDLSLIYVVELDDRTHDTRKNARKDAQRDQLLREAGIRTLRWRATMRPSTGEIRACVDALEEARLSGRGLSNRGLA